MKTPRTGATIKLVIILIILAESAALAYLYKKYHSQRLMTIAVRNTLTRTSGAIQTLQKNIAEKAQAISDLERRFSEAKSPGQSTPGAQNADYLRKRLKESKEMELRMYERIEELSRKQAEMESHAARPDVTPATPPPVATAAVQPTPAPSASATPTPPPHATDAPIKQGPPPVETIAAEKAPPAGEITGRILILNETYNFVIINAGSDNGIEEGDEGTIEHDGAQMGRAKVKKLYNKMCLADIVETSPDAKIQKNYLVKFSRERENRVR